MHTNRASSANRLFSNLQQTHDKNVPIDISEADLSGPELKYFAISPKGPWVEIPKELFIALSDFLETRKCPGDISIHFRSGEITCVEATAKKRYR